MPRQTVYVIGAPMQCGEIGCLDKAVIALRQANSDGSQDTCCYCLRHFDEIVLAQDITAGSPYARDGDDGREML